MRRGFLAFCAGVALLSACGPTGSRPPETTPAATETAPGGAAGAGSAPGVDLATASPIPSPTP